jgi:hypothetical protein
MVAASAPQKLAGRSLFGKFAAMAASRASARQKPSKAAAFIGDHLLTALALGAGVADAFLHGNTWGLASLVPALLVLDFKVRG